MIYNDRAKIQNLKVTSKPKRFCCLKWINYKNFKRECPKRITSVIANAVPAGRQEMKQSLDIKTDCFVVPPRNDVVKSSVYNHL